MDPLERDSTFRAYFVRARRHATYVHRASFSLVILTAMSVDSFILSWDAVCNIFDGAYLSWDPGIFKYETTHHGTWMAGSISLQNEGIRCEQNRHESSTRPLKSGF